MADDPTLLDTRHGGLEGTVGAWLLPAEGGRFVLVETGPLSTLAALEREANDAGYDLDDLAGVLVTHIHLDHAGAAGALSRRTGAPVWVHAGGAEHLRDPARLLASARRAYGDAFDRLLGGMEAVPEGRLRPVDGGDEVEVAGHRFLAVHTPGHASSHLAFLWRGRLFTGDAAAIRLPGVAAVRPATAPPEIDLEAWEASWDRMRAAAPERLLLTHFGAVDEPEAHLDEVERVTRAWADAVLAGLRAGEDAAALAARLVALEDAALRGEDARARARHRGTSSAAMNAAGLARYWRKAHPERLEP